MTYVVYMLKFISLPGTAYSHEFEKTASCGDICLSLFFRDDIFFSKYYTKYTIKIKPP